MKSMIRCADMTDSELILEAKALYWTVNVLECFGSHDVRALDAVLSELADRGYSSYTSIEFEKEQ